ncbi:MAG: hypothetical protein ABW046_20590 [Actinoplanes sp.]
MAGVTVSGIDGPNGLKGLIADLERAAMVTPVETRAVVQKGALNVKTGWRRRWSGLGHAPAVAKSITYDTTARGLTFGAEIGPENHKRQAPLANLLEYGSVNNAPIPGGAPALEEERPKFERALEDLGYRSLGGV